MSHRIAVIVECAAWRRRLPEIASLARRGARAALRTRTAGRDTEFTLLFTDDAGIRALNRRFRRKDKPTNVLAFPSGDAMPGGGAGDAEALGDVALAYETCAREAKEQAKPLRAHMTHLVVHGVLHLLGHDHVRGPEAESMEALERQILAGLAIRDPYAVRRRSR